MDIDRDAKIFDIILVIYSIDEKVSLVLRNQCDSQILREKKKNHILFAQHVLKKLTCKLSK